MIPRPIVRLAASFAAAALLCGCLGDPTPPEDALEIQASGRLERGGVITLSATADGEPVPAGGVAWTVTPASAAQQVDAQRLRLLSAGPVEVRGTYQGRTGTVELNVVRPPTVVFDMAAGGNRDLYRVSLDGGELARVTTHASDDRDPAAGGGTIVFVSFRAGNGELYSVPLVGGEETRITSTTAGESAPALSRDGLRLAYTSDAGGVGKVWTANRDGSSAARAAPGFGFDGSPETSPAWAPNGNLLAFVGTANGTADVFRVTPGAEPALLAGGSAADVDPAWSPDGEHVAFASTRDGDAAIFLVRVSTGVVTKLTTRSGTEAEPAWTFDGRLVYVEFGPASGESRLVWMDLADPGTVHLVPVQGGFPRRPAVAP